MKDGDGCVFLARAALSDHCQLTCLSVCDFAYVCVSATLMISRKLSDRGSCPIRTDKKVPTARRLVMSWRIRDVTIFKD